MGYGVGVSAQNRHSPSSVGDEVAAGGGAVVRALHVVQAVVVGLPDLQQRAGDRPAVDVADGCFDPAGLPRRTEGDVAALLDLRRTGDEERAEHGGLGHVALGRVVDRDRLHRQPEHVGEQDELLPLVVGDVARPR
jgi:hypothetical protein